MIEIYDALKSESESPGTFRETQGAPTPKKVATTGLKMLQIMQLEQEKKNIGGKREGAGRPRRNGKEGPLLNVPQVVYLTDTQKWKLKQRADVEGLSVSEMVRHVIERFVL